MLPRNPRFQFQARFYTSPARAQRSVAIQQAAANWPFREQIRFLIEGMINGGFGLGSFEKSPERNGGIDQDIRNLLKNMAPQVGLEPTTLRLTAGCSAIELLRSIGSRPCRRRLQSTKSIVNRRSSIRQNLNAGPRLSKRPHHST
jgi:hypothetical protein